MSGTDHALLPLRKLRRQNDGVEGDDGECETTPPALPQRTAAFVTAPPLCLCSTPRRGLGVFALRSFARGEIIERAPVILLPDPQWELINRTALQHYYYTWSADMAAVVFGFGSFYNHSDTPNAEFTRHQDELVMEYTALRAIAAGEEVVIKYRCPLWFVAV